jgi:hypothetical protein
LYFLILDLFVIMAAFVAGKAAGNVLKNAAKHGAKHALVHEAKGQAKGAAKGIAKNTAKQYANEAAVDGAFLGASVAAGAVAGGPAGAAAVVAAEVAARSAEQIYLAITGQEIGISMYYLTKVHLDSRYYGYSLHGAKHFMFTGEVALFSGSISNVYVYPFHHRDACLRQCKKNNVATVMYSLNSDGDADEVWYGGMTGAGIALPTVKSCGPWQLAKWLADGTIKY